MPNMEQPGLLNRLLDSLYSEKLNTDAEAASPLRAATNEDRKELLVLVKEANASKEIDLILAVEKAFLTNNLNQYSNSTGMASSLKEAITGVEQTQLLLEVMRDPDQSRYDLINQTHGMSKSRCADGMPKDDGRKFFPSHIIRLKNLDKSNLSVEEKQIITERQAMLRTAQKVYIRHQHQTLGKEAIKEQPSHGREME